MVPLEIIFVGKQPAAGFAFMSLYSRMAVLVLLQEGYREALLAANMTRIFALSPAFEIQLDRMVYAVFLLLVTSFCQIITESYLAVVTFQRTFGRIMPR